MATVAQREKRGGDLRAGSSPALNGRKARSAHCQESDGQRPELRCHRGGFEAGASWTKTSKKGNAYILVALCEPSFHGGTIHPVAVKSETIGILSRRELLSEK